MDKHKLVRIIAKDLEELKTLNDEIEANEDASSLIIDLALSRARLLCQELELLQSFSAPAVSLKEEAEMENYADDEDEESERSFPEPELEILHFEEPDYSNSDELEEEEEEMVVYDSDDEEPDEETEEDFEEDEEPVEEELTENDDSEEEPVEEEEVVAEGFEDDDSTGIEEHELDTDEDEAVSEIEEEEEEEEEPVKPVKQSFRQIEIEELDEEDDDVEFSPVPNPANRPVMHEIPKPEDISSETRLEEKEKEEEEEEKEEEDVEEDDDEQEVTAAETFQKERSLNETLGENKAETNLSNSPITSLRAAIGLNDRFLFIKEIFSNNSEKYNTIIDQLDKMETIQQAVDYLKVNLSLQKNETSMKFVDLLKRRFTK